MYLVYLVFKLPDAETSVGGSAFARELSAIL